MDLFDLVGIPQIYKNVYLNKIRPRSAESFTYMD